jgi:hypothetical protein
MGAAGHTPPPPWNIPRRRRREILNGVPFPTFSAWKNRITSRLARNW